jgi:hypothetical protein
MLDSNIECIGGGLNFYDLKQYAVTKEIVVY